MKSLILTNEFPPNIYGGAGVHVDYLTRELAKLLEVEVRCFGEQSVLEQNLTVSGHRIDEAIFSATDKQIKSPLQAIDRCVRFNATPIDADIVHCHTWYAHFGGILAKQLYDIPLVITTHSLEPLRPWKREQLGHGYDLSCWIEKTAMEMADSIITVSSDMREDVLKWFSIEPERVKVIHNGIDTEEFQPVESLDALVEYGIDPDVPYVLFVGRITRQKGIIHLVNAIKYLQADVQVVLCAGAPDTEEIAAEMAEGVRRVQQTRDGVIWIQKIVDKKSLIELYSHASVFCCPSIYEPFGIINLEAMACMTPVVASAVGGIREVVVQDQTGYLVQLDQDTNSPFEALNPDQFARDLAEAINRIIANPQLGRQLGEYGRARVEEIFSWRSIAAEVKNVYQEMLMAKRITAW